MFLALLVSMFISPAQAQTTPLILAAEEGAFVAGQQLSCGDLVQAKVNKAAPVATIEPQGFQFSKFSLEWSAPTRLNIDSVRAAISDDQNNHAILELAPVDIAGLITSDGASIVGPTVIVSNDPARDQDAKWAPCGLTYGGINWLDSSRDLRVIISVLGTEEKENGDLVPVEASFDTAIYASARP